MMNTSANCFPGALQRHEKYAYLCLRTAELGRNIARARKVTTVNNDRRIMNFTKDLLEHRTISIFRFLRKASTCVLGIFDDFLA